MKKRILQNKGALTLEACIALPVFLFFFLLLLFFIKIAYINITLNSAVSEASKQLATASYPLKFLNEIEDNVLANGEDYKFPTFQQELKKVSDKTYESSKSQANSLFTTFITGENIDKNSLETSLSDLLTSITKTVGQDLKDGIKGYITKNLGDKYFDFKTELKYSSVKYLIESLINDNYINKENIKYTFVELPRSEAEFENRKSDSSYTDICQKINYTPDKDDVVISIEYPIKLPFSFFKNNSCVLKFTSVEKAWMNGSNGLYTIESKDIAKNEDNTQKDTTNQSIEDTYKKSKEIETVYVTNTGTHYHKDGCRMLKKSKIPVKLSDIEQHTVKAAIDGECQICYHGFKIENVNKK